MALQIVPLHNNASESIIELILNIQQKEFHIPITLADQPDLLNIDHSYHQSGGGFWGACIDGQLIGTIALLKFSPHAGALRKMFVKREYRGKEWRAAQQLLDTLIAHCKSTHLTDIYLGTISTMQAALRFYERNHFEQIAKKDLPAEFPLMSADNTFRHLTLHHYEHH